MATPCSPATSPAAAPAAPGSITTTTIASTRRWAAGMRCSRLRRARAAGVGVAGEGGGAGVGGVAAAARSAGPRRSKRVVGGRWVGLVVCGRVWAAMRPCACVQLSSCGSLCLVGRACRVVHLLGCASMHALSRAAACDERTTPINNSRKTTTAASSSAPTAAAKLKDARVERARASMHTAMRPCAQLCRHACCRPK